MAVAGHDPVDYLRKYPRRFPMIHVKDFLPAADKDDAATSPGLRLGAELGHGFIDYRPILAAARAAGLQYCFIEQEAPFSRMSPLEAAKVDYNYLRAISG
jgi:sugar phosphate isomerase/epimerase